MNNYDIPVIPGDGIGPEIIEEGKKTIESAGKIFGFKVKWINYPIGAEYYLKTGKTISEKEIKELGNYKAIYLGSLGDPRVPPGIVESGIIVKLRYYLDQYINYRPIKLLKGVESPLKNKSPEDINMIILRENIEDFYMVLGHETNKEKSNCQLETKRNIYKAKFNIELRTNASEIAYNIGVITRKNTERLMNYGFELARKLNRKRVTCIDKMNVIPQMYGLWRDIAKETSSKYPEIELEFNYADALTMWFIKDPSHYDIVIAPNLFGDIITDLGAMISGGLGLAPSANINPKGTSMFEPIHGSAPKYKGKNIANPCATILSGALMLKFLGEKEAAKIIEDSVKTVLKEGKVLTKDLGGNSSTSDMGDAIAKKLFDYV